jgi:hypothetical protein
MASQDHFIPAARNQAKVSITHLNEKLVLKLGDSLYQIEEAMPK